ncbi:MAG: hypothetical protein V4492_07735 [Chlamydiota bacterium]
MQTVAKMGMLAQSKVNFSIGFGILIIALFWSSLASAEEASSTPPLRKLRFFNVDLHISVIADVRNIFEAMGHEVVDWSLSGHSWVFGREQHPVEILNSQSWYYLDRDMCDRFYERYEDFLDGFDGFIVTHTPSFSMLYERTNKPIIIVNSTRYENPFTISHDKWESLNHYLQAGVKNNRIFIVSNNKGDQGYLKFYTGLHSEHIPSLCEYTRAKYIGSEEGFIFKSAFFPDLKNPQLNQNKSLSHPHSWWELYDYKGVVHFPYQISTMSIFEQYTANVPLFFPSKKFLYALQEERKLLTQLSLYRQWDWGSPNIPGDLNNLNDPEVIRFWVEAADFYDEENMPFIQYFDSFEHLEYLLETTDLHKVSEQMKGYNIYRKKMVYEKWEKLLRRIFV